MSWFETLQQAVALHNAGRLDDARTLYRRVLTENPGEANALHLLGSVVRARGDAAQARILMRRALGLNPGLAPAYSNIANLELSQGDAAAAAEWLEKGLAVAPDDPRLNEVLGRIAQDQAVEHYHRGEKAAAAAWWEKCFAVLVRRSPEQPFYYDLAERLTRIALVLDMPEKAEACVRIRNRVDFAELDPADIDVFAVRLYGFPEWRASTGAPGAEWVAPAQSTPDKLYADYPDYLHVHIDDLKRQETVPVGYAGPAPVEMIQGFYVKDNYESFVVAGRRTALYEVKTLYINGPHVPLVGVTPGAEHGAFRLARPHYRVFDLEAPGIVLPSTPNYWHFLVDVLPKLLIREQNPALADLPAYLYDLRGYHYEMLELAGVPRDKAIDLKPQVDPPPKGRALFRFHNGVVPALVPYPAAYRWLRETFLPHVRPDRPARPKRIFLSRRGAYPKHRLANDAEIGEMLAGYGFEVVQPEKLSVLETVELAADAEIVVAPIGAGTANHVFLPPNATWIHLNNPDFFHPASPWNAQMGTQVTYSGSFRQLTGRLTGDPAEHPQRLVDRLEIPVEIDLKALAALVEEAVARL